MVNKVKNALDELKGSDRIGNGGEALLTVLGGTVGAGAAGSLAAAAGVTTIPVLTSVGSVFGLTILSATPVGWVAGIGLAVGALAFGLGKVIRSGGKNDQIRLDLIRQIRAKMDKKHIEHPGIIDLESLRPVLADVLDRELVTQSQAERIALLVADGRLSFGSAMTRLSSISKAGSRSQRSAMAE